MMGIGDRHSYFTETIFTRRSVVPSSRFIKAMHPKSEINSDPKAIARILELGWVGQMKVHGHRAQIHISADPEAALVIYTRQGKFHTKAMPPAMVKEVRRLFRPKKGWNVIDAEWLKPKDKLFVFDFLKREGESLRALNFPDRYKLLPRHFISPHVSVLPVLRDLPGCLKVMGTRGDHVEGLVFKSTTSTGFSDTSIVRCRRK